jgi:PAS domain S-box-containing protein
VSNADTRADLARNDREDVPPLSSDSRISHFSKWNRAKRHRALLHEAGHLVLGLVSLATVTGLYFWLDVPLVAAAFTYLVVLVLLSLVCNFSSLIVFSFIGVCCLSYFFAPPIFSFRVDYPQDLITISAFLITSFVVNFLVTRVRAEQRDHMRTCEKLRDANQTLEVTNEALRIENEERKRAEQALRESEDKLRQIFETVPGLTWSTGSDGSEGKKVDVQPGFMAQVQAILNVLPAYSWYGTPSGSLTFVNKRQADFLGIPKDHPLRFGIDIGAQWDDWVPLLHPDEHEEARKYWSNCLRTGEGGEQDYRVRDAQGNYRWFLTRAEPLRASDGSLLLWIGVTLDIEELKRAGEALRESEYKLRQIIETVPSHLWSADPNFEPTHLNQHLLNYFGRRFEDFKRGGWEAFLHPDDVPETAKALSHAVQTGTYFQVVHRLRRADGEFRWHHAGGEPLRDQQGNIIQWYGLSVDIDEAKKAEEQLRHSESYLAEAQRLSHTGTWVLSPTTMQYLYWSDENYRIWGFDPLQGPPSREALWQRIHDPDRLWEKVQEALRQKKDFSGEFKIVLPNGTVKYLAATCHHLFSTNGEVVEVIGTNVDVTERKCAEQALRESEYKLRQIVETVPASLWSLAPDGEPTHFNQRLLDYFGKSFEDLKHRGRWTFIHPDDVPEREKAFYHAIQTGTSYQGVLRLRRADGEYRWHHARGEPLRDREGRIVQWYGVSVDIDEAKKAEDRLRRSEANLTEAQRLSHTGSWVLSPAVSKMLYWSEECYRIWGFDPVQGLPYRAMVLQRIHPDDRDRAYNEAQEALRQKRDYTSEFRIVLPDGTVKYLEAIGHHVFSAHGELVEVVGTNVDVTERKRAEQALRASEAKIRRLVDANIIGIFIWDFNGRILEANEAFLDLLGYDHEDLVAGRIRWTDLTPPEWRDRDTRLIQQQKVSGTLQPFEKEYFRKDGSRVPVLIGVATFEEGGNQGVAFVLDLTKRKCAEQALRESEGKFRDYAETASDWFWEIGPDYKFTLLTENAFGSQAAVRIGTCCWDHALDLETEPEKWRLVSTTLDSRKPFRDFVYCCGGGNGAPMYVKASGKPVFDANGEFRGYRGTGTDVTATVRAQEEHERLRQLESDLAHMNRLSVMGELTASLAHEITQPIATARNNARAAIGFLDRSPPDLSEVKEAIECIVADADRAGDIIDRIRDQIKKAPARKGRFDLNEAIDEVIVLARSEITKNGVSVETRLTEGLASVQGDRVQLQQVVLNLILNAVEAMSSVEVEARELLISTEQNQTGDVLVAVRDSGPGIDPKHVERVFEAFYTTKSKGVGMGLSICRSIIDAHGGRLWADVNKPRGAVFQFTLPSAEAGLMNPLPAVQRTEKPREDIAPDASHQRAYEGSKRLHRSGHEPGQRHWGRQ